MRAALTSGPGEPLRVDDVADPRPGAGELLVAVSRCGICGSDLHSGHLAPAGQVLGHEFAGEIIEVGPETDTTWRIGQRVAAFPLVGCGRCAACLTGRTQRCPSVGLVGFTRPGGFAELATIGAREALALPDGISDAEGALVEPLAVGLYAYRRTEVEPGEPVLVAGGGPVGLAVAVWARALGVGEVVISEPAEGRRRVAERLGFATVDPTVDELGAAFTAITGRTPRAIVECVGRAGLVDSLLAVAADDARLTVAGLCTTPDTVHHLSGLLKGITLRYVLYYERADFDTALRLLGDDRFDAGPLLSETISLPDLPHRFEELKAPNEAVKVQIDPRAS